MKLIPLHTHLMVADALTKSLPGPVLSNHRDIDVWANTLAPQHRHDSLDEVEGKVGR